MNKKFWIDTLERAVKTAAQTALATIGATAVLTEIHWGIVASSVKAFFHFMFKHLFEAEFGIRVAVEIVVFLLLVYLLLIISHRIILKIIGVVRKTSRFLSKELITPLRVRICEKLAFTTNNPNWQNRANKIKDVFKKNESESANSGEDKKVEKKNYVGWWILTYIILVGWILGFHYLGDDKRDHYEVFFWPENTILAFEDWTTNTLLSTDEDAIECFFHNRIEAD